MYESFSGIRNALVKIKEHIENTVENEVNSMKQTGDTFILQKQVRDEMNIPHEERRYIRAAQREERRQKRIRAMNK